MSLDVDRIRAAVAAAKGASDELTAIVEGLSQIATVSPHSPIVFDHEELEIQIGMRGRWAWLIERLEQIEPLKLGVAPIVAAVFSTDESDVLVLRYWAVPGEQRLAFDRAYEPTGPAQGRFRHDLMKLAKAGWIHAYAQRGTLYHQVGSKTGTIVLREWRALEPLEDDEQVR
jgi:hypothetical protein